MTRPDDPGWTAAADQAIATARDVVAPVGAVITDTRDALLSVVVYPDGRVISTTQAATPDGATDWRWVADALRRLAVGADAQAEELGQ